MTTGESAGPATPLSCLHAPIEDLVAHMGIQRGSLYATFGDKRTLFLAALDRYQRVVTRELFEALEAPGSPGTARSPACMPRHVTRPEP